MVSHITKPQIAKIWALAHELGLDREALYHLVPGGSISHLNRTEASDLIEALDRLRGVTPPEPAPPAALERHGPTEPMTPRQLHFIHFLMGRLGWTADADHARNFLRKYFHVENPQDLPNRQRASAVIEALKGVLTHQQRKSSASCAN